MVLKRLLGAIALAIATAGPPALAQEAATVELVLSLGCHAISFRK